MIFIGNHLLSIDKDLYRRPVIELVVPVGSQKDSPDLSYVLVKLEILLYRLIRGDEDSYVIASALDRSHFNLDLPWNGTAPL